VQIPVPQKKKERKKRKEESKKNVNEMLANVWYF
jgi:hypothetical protein